MCYAKLLKPFRLLGSYPTRADARLIGEEPEEYLDEVVEAISYPLIPSKMNLSNLWLQN